MHAFPQFTLDYVRKRLPAGQGWAYYVWAKEYLASQWGERIERKSPAYIAQEAVKIREQRKRERRN